jgi:hypothetical protein
VSPTKTSQSGNARRLRESTGYHESLAPELQGAAPRDATVVGLLERGDPSAVAREDEAGGGLAPLAPRELGGLADGAGPDVGGRDEAVGGEAGDVERHLLDGPRLLHAGLGVAQPHGRLAEPEQGHGGPPGVRHHHAVHGAVVLDGRADGRLPVHRVAAGGGLDPGQVRVLQVHEESGLVAEVAEQHVPDDLRQPLAARPKSLRVRAQLQDEAVLPVHLPLADAPRAGEHARRRQRVQALRITKTQGREQQRVSLRFNVPLKHGRHTQRTGTDGRAVAHLQSAAERAHGALGGVRAEPGGVAPDELAVAAGVHLAPAHGQLHVPHLRRHLPQHEAPGLGALRRHAVPDDAAARLELGRHHPHLAHGVRVADGGQQPLPARRRQVLLQYVLRRRRLLRARVQYAMSYTVTIRTNKKTEIYSKCIFFGKKTGNGYGKHPSVACHVKTGKGSHLYSRNVV